jgi:hypothetical protein
VFDIPMAWFEGGLVFYPVHTLSYLSRTIFHSYLPNLPIASIVMLAYIWLIVLVTVLG